MCRFPVFIDWVTEKINIEKISYENQYSQFWPFFTYFLFSVFKNFHPKPVYNTIEYSWSPTV